MRFLLFCLGTVSLIWVALYNGYPLLYSDTGTYLKSSIDLSSPDDRPIFYGLFLRITAMQANTWIPILFQGIIGYWILLRMTKLYLPNWTAYWTLLIALSLSFLTALPWYAGQLMPDIFTAYGIFLVYLLFYDESNVPSTLLYFLLLFLCASSHLSNVLILGASFGFLTLINLKKIVGKNRRFRVKWFIGIGLIGIVFPLQALLNYLEKGEFVVTRASNIFFVAKGLESDLYKTYVRENKERMQIPFEDETEQFEDSPGWFLWSGESPLNSSGIPRDEINRKFDPIVADIMSQWRYQKMYALEAIRAGKEQLKFHRVGSGLVPYDENSAPGYIIGLEFESELQAFKSAKQFKSGLEDNYHVPISRTIFNTSLLILLFSLLYKPTRQKIGLLVVFILLSAVFNAVVTGGVANVYDRLQVRVNWLYVYAAMLSLFIVGKILIQKARKKEVK